LFKLVALAYPHIQFSQVGYKKILTKINLLSNLFLCLSPFSLFVSFLVLFSFLKRKNANANAKGEREKGE